MNSYPLNDPGPDFDADETARAQAYGEHMRRIALHRRAALQALEAPKQPYLDLVHRMRPIMESAPPPFEAV